MIKTDLKRQVKAFLQTLSDKKSERTVTDYDEGLGALTLFFENYFEDDSRAMTVRDIKPGDIDYILSYFVIRKFMDGVTFRINAAESIKAFFKYLSTIGAYGKQDAAEIARTADHYKKQYPRIDRLENVLWKEVESEVDEVMKLPKKQQKAAIDRLKTATKDAVLKEVGYVSVYRIEGNLMYGSIVDAKDEAVGPVRVGAESLKLIEVGDIINMITLRRLKGDAAWEIAELGYVYPRPFNSKT